MNTQLFIPTKIKVGFNMRPDTYTGKLGYVIAWDGKVWRKETSWENWREKYMAPELYNVKKREQFDSHLKYMKQNNYYTKEAIEIFEKSYDTFPANVHGFSPDPTIEPVEFDNNPTEGFVLNKKVGGYKSDWHVRQTKSRVYDPRGFEFEISVENLLYILQETNSIKGKGLEGEFVYAWDGKDLVLLPACSPDYQKCVNFNSIQKNKVNLKSLVPGGTYLTKKEEELIYLGKFDWFPYTYGKGKTRYEIKETQPQKTHIFVDKQGHHVINNSGSFLANVISDSPVDNYAELVQNFLKEKYSSKVKEFVSKQEEIKFPVDNPTGYRSSYVEGKLYHKINDNKYIKYSVLEEIDVQYHWISNKHEAKKINKGFSMQPHNEITIENGVLTNKNTYDYNSAKNNKVFYSKEDVLAMNFQNLYVVLEDGREFEIEKY